MPQVSSENSQARLPYWWRWAVCFLCAAALMLWGSMKFYQIPIEQITLAGTDDEVARQEVAVLLAEVKDQGFFEVKLSDLKQSISEVPWVDRVAIKRSWPTNLSVEVFPHKLLASWEQGGYLTESGLLLEKLSPGSTMPAVRLAGPEGTQQQVFTTYHTLQSRLANIGRSVQAVSLADRGAWQIELDNHIVIYLGRSDFDGRLTRFIQAYQHTLHTKAKRIQYVDLRYDEGFAVGMKKTGS